MLETEANLVREAQRGDKAAFEEMVRRCSKLVFAKLILDVGDTHQAEDLLQETFLTAFRRLGDLADVNKFRPWLLRIAQNAVIDAARMGNRDKRTPRPLPLRQEASPDESAEIEERREQVRTALRSLPEEYREPLTMRYLLGADYETIQEQMGLTNGSLRGYLHRGLEMLRKALEPST